MSSQFQHARRDFLRWASALTGAAVVPNVAMAQGVSDYRAMVCIFLAGGNDGHNLLVPTDVAPYSAYRAIRGPLALPDVSAQLIGVLTPAGVSYGLNSGLNAIAPQWAQGRLAVVANVGPLATPTTRAQYLTGTVSLPSNLFSHSDQMLQTQTGNATGGGGTGWAGRSADAMVARNSGSLFPAAVSMAGSAVFATGNQVPTASLVPGFDLSLDGLQVWPDTAAQARVRGLTEILQIDNGLSLVQASNRVRRDAQSLHGLLRGGGAASVLGTAFPGTNLGAQLQQVAKIIRLRDNVGVRRQVFFCSLGGFDTHSNQGWTHWDLLRQLGDAMGAFYAATVEMGVATQVTSFTQSEFGRTLQPSGSGSDHGWGNHHLVLGGSVRGGDVYGRFPYPALGGANDCGSRGALIPSTSLEQFGATLARWFGVSATDMPAVFPNLAAFAPADLGFMN